MCLIPLEDDEFIPEGQVRRAYKVIWDDGTRQFTGPFSHQRITWGEWMKAESAIDEVETAYEKERVLQYDDWYFASHAVMFRNPASGFRISSHGIEGVDPCFHIFFSQVLAAQYLAAIVYDFHTSYGFLAGQLRVVQVQVRGRLRTGKLEPTVVFGNNPAATATEIYFDAS